jgi:hypothetical protein
MTNLDTRAKEAKVVELTRDELDLVTAGSGKSGGNTSGHMYLHFQFKLVAVKTISWS